MTSRVTGSTSFAPKPHISQPHANRVVSTYASGRDEQHYQSGFRLSINSPCYTPWLCDAQGERVRPTT